MNHYELFNTIANTFDFFETSYEKVGIDANLEAYEENKSFLVNMLRKHPAWNEEAHAIILSVEEQRDKAEPHELVEMFWRMVYMVPDENRMKLTTCMLFENLCTEPTVSNFAAEAINATFPEIRAAEGQKTSRLINKLMKHLGVNTDDIEYKHAFAEFADAINPYTVDRPFILSANPGDYISMSYGTSWASCHIANPDMARSGETYSGCYRLGTLSYMNDPCSVVAYTLEKLPENLSEIATVPKLTRQMFMIDFNRPLILQSRLYPYTHDENRRKSYRAAVQEIVAKVMEVPNLWVKKNGVYGFTTANPSYHYRDYEHSDWHPNTSMLSGTDVNDIYYNMEIGNETYCLETGKAMNGNDSNTFYFDRGDYQCEYCGDWFDEGDVRYIDGFGYVCDNCLENRYTQCDDCGEWVNNDEIYTAYRGGDIVYVCHDCIEYRYYCCNECGEYIHENDTVYAYDEYGNETIICEECEDRYYFRCDECGEMHHNDNEHEYGDLHLCNACYENTENRDDEEDVA